MNKVLKGLKIALYVILFALLITIVVCYCVIPEQAKGVMDQIIVYLNTPIGITGLSIFSIGYIAFKILQSTSFGKKALGTLKNDYNNVVQKVDDNKKIVDDKVKELNQQKEEIKDILGGYQEQIDCLTNKLAKVCQISPNAKIRALTDEVLGEVEEVKNNTIISLQEKGNALKDEVKETTNARISELEKELKLVIEQVKENTENQKKLLEEKVDDIVVAGLEQAKEKLDTAKVLVEDYGERKETIND